jgi:cob(I)alamin adenosyltransferase
MVILDEILNAILFKLITEEEALAILPLKAASTELVLTGRSASEAMIEQADLVTEMREIKHYYQQGVQSRTGIEE